MGRLQRGKDAECRLFQVVAERGHYAGRVEPTNTRQGIYAIAPGGQFLASVNTRDRRRVARMLNVALERWDAMPVVDRERDHGVDRPGDTAKWWDDRYPEEGLALVQYIVDLPRDAPEQNEPRRRGRSWHTFARNQDHVWFNEAEMRSFLPRGYELTSPKPGTVVEVPKSIGNRLAKVHLVDSVRGQVPAFDDGHIDLATLTSEVESATPGEIVIRITGQTRAVANGEWPVRGFDDRNSPQPQSRGVETRLLGHATFDRRAGLFTEFELIAIGERFGGTQYNARERDLEPNPIGFYFTLAEPDDRVAPAMLWKYGW